MSNRNLHQKLIISAYFFFLIEKRNCHDKLHLHNTTTYLFLTLYVYKLRIRMHTLNTEAILIGHSTHLRHTHTYATHLPLPISVLFYFILFIRFVCAQRTLDESKTWFLSQFIFFPSASCRCSFFTCIHCICLVDVRHASSSKAMIRLSSCHDSQMFCDRARTPFLMSTHVSIVISIKSRKKREEEKIAAISVNQANSNSFQIRVYWLYSIYIRARAHTQFIDSKRYICQHEDMYVVRVQFSLSLLLDCSP